MTAWSSSMRDKIVEDCPPEEFFTEAKSQRARDFVDKILHH